MSKPLLCVVLIVFVVVIAFSRANAQEFRWPRERAFEIGGGGSASGGHFRIGHIWFFQPKKISEIPFNKRFKTLVGQDRYVSFPCKRKPTHKAPPGLSAKVALIYEVGSSRGFQYQIIDFDASIRYIIYTTKKTYISLAGGASISNNRLISAVKEGGKSNYYDRFKYGVLGGAEVDHMLGKRQSTSVVLGWEQYYLIKSDSWGVKRWYGFVALRFKIPTY